MKKDFLVKTGRKILPKSRFRSYIGKKFQKQVIDENNNRVWGTDTNTPLQSLEAMKFTLTLLEKCVTTLEGDVIECGVYKGGTSFQIAKKLKSLNSKKYLYDSIRMLEDPYPNAFLNLGKHKIIFKHAKLKNNKLSVEAVIE